MKTAYDCAPVKRVTAWALTFNGERAGKLVAAYGRSRVTCTISAWLGPLKDYEKMTGWASGYGYHKLSAAMEDALDRAKVPLKHDSINGRGDSAMREFFEAQGYQVLEVL